MGNGAKIQENEEEEEEEEEEKEGKAEREIKGVYLRLTHFLYVYI